jgi:hypothetical protein
MTYQVQFLRTGVMTDRSELFETLQQAEAFADEEVGRRKPGPEVVAIVEIDDDGNQGRIQRLQRF